MALAARTPTVVKLSSGDIPIRNDLVAVETITPGMLVEYHNDSGTLKWGVHDSADGAVQAAVALDEPEFQNGLSDNYAAGSKVRVGYFRTGDQFYGIVPSGQSITQGAYLQSNGDGKLKALGSGTGLVVAIETIGTVSADTRCRVEVT